MQVEIKILSRSNKSIFTGNFKEDKFANFYLFIGILLPTMPKNVYILSFYLYFILLRP